MPSETKSEKCRLIIAALKRNDSLRSDAWRRKWNRRAVSTIHALPKDLEGTAIAIDATREEMSLLCKLRAENARLNNQLAALQAQVAWRQIDSAPKDGTLIICRRDNRVAIGRWVGRYFSWGWADEPTHWQPMPRWQEGISHEYE